MRFFAAFAFPLLFCFGAFAETAQISMIGSNAVDRDLPLGVFNGQGFHPLPDARYVKLHLYPDRPIKNVGRVEIEACDKWPEPKARYGSPQRPEFGFVNFNEAMTSQGDEDDSHYVNLDLANPKTLRLRGNDTEAGEPGPLPTIESLTVNFGDVDHVCVRSVKFFDVKNKQITIEAPKAVNAAISASSVQLPAEAYAPENMFDSKFENAWATNKIMGGASLKFKFDAATKIEKIKIWNGYQRSVTHCQQNSRVKTLELASPDGYKATVAVADKLGSQEIALPKPFSGQELTITVKDAVKGKTYADLAITEMRFFDGKNWLLVNPVAHIQEVNRKIREQFAKANLAAMLNDELKTSGDFANWAFRLRSDGSLFIEGNVAGDEEGTSYSALGNFEIKSAGPEGLQLRTFGFIYKSKYGMDCNGCGVACNSPDKQDGTSQKIFQQMITLRPSSVAGSVDVVTDGKSAKMKFTKLTIRKEER